MANNYEPVSNYCNTDYDYCEARLEEHDKVIVESIVCDAGYWLWYKCDSYFTWAVQTAEKCKDRELELECEEIWHFKRRRSERDYAERHPIECIDLTEDEADDIAVIDDSDEEDWREYSNWRNNNRHVEFRFCDKPNCYGHYDNGRCMAVEMIDDEYVIKRY